VRLDGAERIPSIVGRTLAPALVTAHLPIVAAATGTRINATDDDGSMLAVIIIAGIVLVPVVVGLIWRWSDQRRDGR